MRLLAEFLLIPAELFQPLIKLDAAAKLIDEVARALRRRVEVGRVEIGQGFAYLLVDAGGLLMGVLGIAAVSPVLPHGLAQPLARLAEPRERLGRELRQAVLSLRRAETHLLVLGEHRRVQVVMLLFEFGYLAFERVEPRVLLERGDDARTAAAEGLVNIQFGRFAKQLSPMVAKPLHARVVFRGAPFECFEAIERVGRHTVGWTEPGQLLAQRPMPMPAIADAQGQIVQVELFL